MAGHKIGGIVADGNYVVIGPQVDLMDWICTHSEGDFFYLDGVVYSVSMTPYTDKLFHVVYISSNALIEAGFQVTQRVNLLHLSLVQSVARLEVTAEALDGAWAGC